MSDIAIKVKNLGGRVRQSRNEVKTRFSANAIVVPSNRYRYGDNQKAN